MIMIIKEVVEFDFDETCMGENKHIKVSQCNLDHTAKSGMGR